MAMAAHPRASRLARLASHLAAPGAAAARLRGGRVASHGAAGALSLSATTTLRLGNEMPVFGLGTFLAEMGGECLNACKDALAMGYVMIDTASGYHNEEEVGAALGALAGRQNRGDIFLVTKQSEEHGRAATLAAMDASLARLGVDYVDLYLVHNPSNGAVLETWRAMLEIKAAGKARAVGVSNFGVAQLAGIKAAGLEMPEVTPMKGGGGGFAFFRFADNRLFIRFCFCLKRRCDRPL
jgi:hypothetical protein